MNFWYLIKAAAAADIKNSTLRKAVNRKRIAGYTVIGVKK